MNAADVKAALRDLHPHQAGEWAFLEEYRWSVGVSYVSTVDALAISCWRSKPSWQGHKLNKRRLAVVAYEVKVSRADFLDEVYRPEKRALARLYSNLFLFACPAAMVTPDEVPPDCGLVWVNDDGQASVVLRAPYSHNADPSWFLMASLARRCATVERTLEQERSW